MRFHRPALFAHPYFVFLQGLCSRPPPPPPPSLPSHATWSSMLPGPGLPARLDILLPTLVLPHICNLTGNICPQLTTLLDTKPDGKSNGNSAHFARLRLASRLWLSNIGPSRSIAALRRQRCYVKRRMTQSHPAAARQTSERWELLCRDSCTLRGCLCVITIVSCNYCV